ncbi:MAG: hypothetical protein ABID09_03440 [Candidatus Omnitrophota bacterium]
MTKAIIQSKTKMGAVIGGIAIIGGSIGALYEGAIDGGTFTQQLLLGIGIILFGLGIRDALDSPKK